MSRGIGKTQQRILDYVNSHDEPSTVADISALVGASPRQVRAAVHSLHDRRLVFLGKGWTGEFREPTTWYQFVKRAPEGAMAVTAFAGHPRPGRPEQVAPDHGDWIFRESTVPTGAQLYVWPSSEVEQLHELNRKIAAIWAR